MKLASPICALLGAALVLSSPAAHASLTSSEKGVVKEYVAAARLDTAQKVRSLVARTDLTPEESAEALSEAVAAVPFTDARGGYLAELVFGASSAPSRPVIVLATVKALLGRADAIYQRYVGGLDHEPKAIAELVAIYGWIDQEIANAGKPTSAEHDPTAGIPVATYDACSKALRDHIDQNARWLKGDGTVPGPTVRLRAQAQVALADMLPDGVTRRVEAADRLGLKGARRRLLIDYGALLEDSGKLDDAAADRVRQLIARLPAVQNDLGLVCIEEGNVPTGAPSIHARGQVVHVAPGPEAYPFDDPAPASYDAATSAIAHDLGVAVAMRVLDNRWGQLRLQAERDMALIRGDRTRFLGKPRGPSVEYVIGAAIHTLLIDAPKALDVAVSRGSGGHTESAALLSDALGVLAAPAPPGDKSVTGATKVELGKPGGSGTVTATALRAAPNGAVVAFKVDGHAWAIDRASPSYLILAIRKDGQTVASGEIVSKAVTEPKTKK
jgi:hypothetical protein